MPDLFDALAARPRLARSLAAHLRDLHEGAIPARTLELIALMVGWLNACEYCTCVHEEIARKLGVDEATLAALGDFALSPHFSEAERAALSATVALTREPRALPPVVWDALRAHYDEGASLEILAAIGANNYVSRLSNALQLRAP
ncbi:MAG TPA: carboxymuconolactone decarboxylase family protein [Candidatus Baltobacteraceae bacterium]|nr:carboxymuconolactone decarboxylase family protein [Candidatus Baltobacteraceae bacterium]